MGSRARSGPRTPPGMAMSSSTSRHRPRRGRLLRLRRPPGAGHPRRRAGRAEGRSRRRGPRLAYPRRPSGRALAAASAPPPQPPLDHRFSGLRPAPILSAPVGHSNLQATSAWIRQRPRRSSRDDPSAPPRRASVARAQRPIAAMTRFMLRAKIHRATVTAADLEYGGIDQRRSRPHGTRSASPNGSRSTSSTSPTARASRPTSSRRLLALARSRSTAPPRTSCIPATG